AGPRAPLLLTVHGLEVFLPALRRLAHFRGPAGLYRRLLGRWLALRSLQRAQGVISIAGRYTETILGPALAGKRIFYIANPVADAFFGVPDLAPDAPPVVLSPWPIPVLNNVRGLGHASA